MEFRPEKLSQSIARLDALLAAMGPHLSPNTRPAVERWRADAAALRFHLLPRRDGLPLLAVIGGTGTGKSTLVNRLLGGNLTAASFRRTFTSGPVAIARAPGDVPEGWLGLEHVVAPEAELPARGRAGILTVATAASDITAHVVLVDTPDLDGDQPAHHAEADRVFRWAQAVLFLVTPEKYQMTELLPYYRLAARYAVPALFCMNKCEEQAVVEDYRLLLRGQAGSAGPPVYVVARDDAGFEPRPGENLATLRAAVQSLPLPATTTTVEGLRHRAEDLRSRLADQVLNPLWQDRRDADNLITSLRGMETPAPGVDVNPLTQQLQRRFQQRSVLYLMGPQRVLDRVRQAPGLLVRLPRVAWDYLMRGEIAPDALNPQTDGRERQVPDFREILADQFAVVQSRIDDALRASPRAARWTEDPGSGYAAARIDPARAGSIAEEEIAALNDWLEKRWNATPRDTRMLQTLLKHLPGGKKLTQWTEAAPYLLTIILVTHHAFFGHIDLLVLGGWSLATWLTERISNEVAAHTRQTNQRITDRFARLAHEQIETTCAWLNRQAPSTKALDQLERTLDEAGEA